MEFYHRLEIPMWITKINDSIIDDDKYVLIRLEITEALNDE